MNHSLMNHRLMTASFTDHGCMIDNFMT